MSKKQALHILYIGNKLSAHGNNLSYIETLGPLLEDSGYVLSYASDHSNKAFRFADMMFSVFKQSRKVDVVIIDTYSTLNYWYAIAVAKLCVAFSIPYLPILHGGNLPHRVKTSYNTFKFLIENSYVSICPSTYLKESLLTAGFSNTQVIKNTIPIEDYPFKLRSQAAPKLLWVRSFSKIYNPEMAIYVFKEIKKKYPEAQLCMIGPDKDGSLETTKQLAQSLQLEVDFPGKMTKEAWRARSREYDIFINTTHFDNVPISVLEAMALGMPVVSTDVGGIPFMLENEQTALLVKDNDVDQMFEAIISLLESAVLTERISQTARLEAQSYSWNEVKKDWNEVLNTIPLKS